MMENASLFVAGVPGIDVVFTGHQHLVFPNSQGFRRHRTAPTSTRAR